MNGIIIHDSVYCIQICIVLAGAWVEPPVMGGRGPSQTRTRVRVVPSLTSLSRPSIASNVRYRQPAHPPLNCLDLRPTHPSCSTAPSPPSRGVWQPAPPPHSPDPLPQQRQRGYWARHVHGVCLLLSSYRSRGRIRHAHRDSCGSLISHVSMGRKQRSILKFEELVLMKWLYPDRIR